MPTGARVQWVGMYSTRVVVIWLAFLETFLANYFMSLFAHAHSLFLSLPFVSPSIFPLPSSSFLSLQNVNYQPHFNPVMSVANQMHGMGIPQRQPSINPSLMRPQQGPMGRGMPGMAGGGMMQQHSGPGAMAMAMGRGGMGMGGGIPAGMGRVGGVYGGPMVQQVQTGFTSDISGSVQPVMAVPNPSYLPASSVGGIRQPAPPYDSVGVSII